MTVEVHREIGRHDPVAEKYFDFARLDVFHSAEVLTAVHGDTWQSVLITEGQYAFLHAFRRNAIPGSLWSDIEPLLGYAGPVTNTSAPDFVALAWRAYGNICRDDNIVAELVRFSPLLENHRPFAGCFPVHETKEVVFVRCHDDEAAQLAEFSSSGARDVRKRSRGCEFRPLDKETEWRLFVRLYRESIARLAAAPEWAFDDAFFNRLSGSRHVDAYGVWHNGRLESAAVVVSHPLAAYFLLAANRAHMVRGASKYLIYRIARETAQRMTPWLILGGGNSNDPADSLLAFKKKFARTTRRFSIGRIVHMQREYELLCEQALRRSPTVADEKVLLKYRRAG